MFSPTSPRVARSWWLALASAAFLLVAPDAIARTVTLRWLQPSLQDVSGFRVHIGSAPGSYGQVVDVGMPVPASGVYSAAVSIPDNVSSFVALTAYGSKGSSPYSNEIGFAAPMSMQGSLVPTGASFADGSGIAVLGDIARLAWLAGTGPASQYRVGMRWVGQSAPFREMVVATALATVQMTPGTTIEVIVTPLDPHGLGGTPGSPLRIRFLDPQGNDDGDAWSNALDNCPVRANSNQGDADVDGVGDTCDACPSVANADQRDLDRDGLGDACDADADGDGIAAGDLCPLLALPATLDSDGDRLGNLCDPCTAFAWSAIPRDPPDQNPVRSLVRFSGLNQTDRRTLVLSGRFNPAIPFAPFDPVVEGVSISVVDAFGALFELGVPPGRRGQMPCHRLDGWRAVRPHSGDVTWTYFNRSTAFDAPACTPGTSQGVSRVVIRDRRATKGFVEFRVVATRMELPRVPATPVHRLEARVALGAANSPFTASNAAQTGVCVETRFVGAPVPAVKPEPFCKPGLVSGVVRTLECRGPKEP